jgi:hypothetical protein
MKFHSITSLVLSMGAGLSLFVGCDFEVPAIDATGGTGGGEGGTGGSSGSSSSSSSSGQGGGGTCQPGEVAVCAYDGPSVTMNVGTCKPSSQECTPNGTWASCEGQVLPVPEGCGGTTDINCDTRLPCTGEPIEAFSAGAQTAQDEAILAMATDAAYKGKDGATYGAGFRMATSVNQLFTNSRVLLWSRNADGVIDDWSNLFAFTSNGAQQNGAYATGVTIVPTTGHIVVVGNFFNGSLTIGNYDLGSTTSMNTFIVKFFPNGAVVDAQRIGGSNHVETRAVVTDNAGTTYVGGNYRGAPQIGAAMLPATTDDDAFIAAFNSDGTSWTRTLGGMAYQGVVAMASAGGSDVVVTMSIAGDTSITTPGGVQIFAAGINADILLSRLRGTDGFATWNAHVKTNDAMGNSLAIGAVAATSTKVALSGVFQGTVELNGQILSTADADSFIATFAANDGNFQDYLVLGGSGTQEVRGVAIDTFGDFVIAGAFTNSLPLGIPPLVASGQSDAFVAKLDANLDGKWSRKFGDDVSQSSTPVVIGGATGHIFAGGVFQGQLTGISPLLTSTGGLDAFMIELSN